MLSKLSLWLLLDYIIVTIEDDYNDNTDDEDAVTEEDSANSDNSGDASMIQHCFEIHDENCQHLFSISDGNFVKFPPGGNLAIWKGSLVLGYHLNISINFTSVAYEKS